MKRYHAYVGILLIACAIWLTSMINIDSINSDNHKWIIKVAPLYFIMLFGTYCLSKLGFDLVTFNDYPKEIQSLYDYYYNLHNVCIIININIICKYN